MASKNINDIVIVINGISISTYATKEECEKIINILDTEHSDQLGEVWFEDRRQMIEKSYKD